MTTFIPAGDAEQLQVLVDTAKAGTLALARHSLDTLAPQTIGDITALQAIGWRIGLEVSADVHGQVGIALTMIPPSGIERRVVAEIVEGVASGSAH